MEAKPFFSSLLLAAACQVASAEQPPLPFPMQGEPQSLGVAPKELAQPLPLEGMKPGEQVRDAFAIDPEHAAKPRKKEDNVELASLTPESARGQELLTLYAAAERAAGRGRSISDLTDLIERCEQTASKLDGPAQGALDRLTSWAYNRRGERLTVAARPREAFADFQHAIVLDERNAPALANRGVTLAEHGQTEDALADFSRAVALCPSNHAYRRNRAELLTELGRYQEALRDYAAAFKHGPADAGLYSGSGFCQVRLGRRQQALRDYNQALKLDPRDAQTLALRGALYAEAGYFEQATTDLSAALAADPASVDAYRSVAWLLATCPDERFRDSDKALEAARRAQRFSRADDPLILDVLAAAHASAGQMHEAVRVEQQAALLAPDELKQAFEHRLSLYLSGRPYRAPALRVAATSVRTQAQR